MCNFFRKIVVNIAKYKKFRLKVDNKLNIWNICLVAILSWDEKLQFLAMTW